LGTLRRRAERKKRLRKLIGEGGREGREGGRRCERRYNPYSKFLLPSVTDAMTETNLPT